MVAIKNYIKPDDIQISKTALYAMHDICLQEQLDPRNLFIYFNTSIESIYIGFSSDESKHIELGDDQWHPAYQELVT